MTEKGVTKMATTDMTHAERMALVRDDLADDARRLDSTPFTPRGMGETFGALMACVAAVADTLHVICKREGL
jgi:hypothetical protein